MEFTRNKESRNKEREREREKKDSNSSLKLPSLVKNGNPETSPRLTIQAISRRPSGGSTNSRRTSSSEENTRSTEETQVNQPPNPRVSSGKAPVKMQRAKAWSPEVENLFRYQAAGFRDQEEYISVYPQPEYWDSGFIKSLQAKQTGYFMYFRQDRECADKYLNKIKIYSYGEER